MSRPSAWEKEAARVTSEVARRAIRRLDLFEWVILAGTVGLSVGGGALVAWILVGGESESYRLVWTILSVLLLVVPGVTVLARHRQDERLRSEESEKLRTEDDG